MRLYRGQPTTEAVATGQARMAEWLKAAVASNPTLPLVRAQGRWFTDDLEIALWYADDAGVDCEVVMVEVGDEIAEAFRLSNLEGPLGCGLNPLAFSRDPEHEFMLPRHIADRAAVLTSEILFEGPSSTRQLTPGELAFVARDATAITDRLDALFAARTPRTDFAARRADHHAIMAALG